MSHRWIELAGAANVRDLGGLPTSTAGATTRFGRVLRSDNLQGLTAADVARLTTVFRVRDVIDLRTTSEITSEGPGPMTRAPGVTVHHLSLLPEVGESTDVEAEAVLPRREDVPGPWDPVGLSYTSYLRRRPESVVAALRTMARGTGATIAHCAAGKDRTGVVCAMALSVADVERDAIVADYLQTGERMRAVLTRLAASPTYVDDLEVDAHRPRADAMVTFFAYVDTEFGGPLGWLRQHGWTESDTQTLRGRLLGDGAAAEPAS